jgi:hypothetical protein
MNEAPHDPDRSARAVTIHNHAHALAALAALPGGRRGPWRLILLSAPGAAGFLGPGWWAALINSLQPRMHAAGVRDLLDCGASAGRAMEALRIGVRGLILSPECPQFEAVLARATPLAARLERERPAALDLAEKNAVRRLADWLGGGAPR